MSYRDGTLQVGFPKPGKTLKVVLIGVFAVWLAFAIGLNWAGAPESAFTIFCGSTEAILRGEVWRLLTAPWMHLPVGSLGHVLSVLLGLYFLGPSLEESWGSKRFAWFLFFSSIIAYGTQMVFELVMPARISARLVGEYWYGAMPVVEAIAIAYALSFRGRVVRLFFVLPVSSRGLIAFVVGVSVLYVIIAAQTPSGLVAPFGGMLAGWLLGGSSPSPLRRAWLKLRLAQLDAEARREARARKGRIGKSGLRVIEGGRQRDSDSGEQPSKSDGRWLN
ncbi:MAG TPA: rhomboid family intramembrane serine protease [Polyangiaceae bacterium]